MEDRAASLPDLHAHAVPCVAAASYPVRAGNRLRALIDSGPAFRRICEAVDAARRSVWPTVTFVAIDYAMPDGRGSFLDVLDRAAARGVDVRVIFWRPNAQSSGYGQTFAGTPDDFALLRARGSRFLARWDRAARGFCQHQKFWLIDAGQSTETAFVGGINPTFAAVEPGHAGEGGHSRHDAYVEVAGPSATDVHHNFVQRWNEASERDEADGMWPCRGDGIEMGNAVDGAHAIDGTHATPSAPLPFPERLSAPCGKSAVQIQRNIYAGRYRVRHASPGGLAYDIEAGEHSISDQYVRAIRAARRSIYIENQALPVASVAAELDAALERGVRVVYLAPGEPEAYVRMWREGGEYAAFFERIAALGRHEHFSLAGLAGPDATAGRHHVYVHAKLMLIDDAWATIGSCNLHANSLTGHSELNVSVWDAEWVRALRCELLREHLDEDTSAMTDRAAFTRYACIARENAARWRAGHGAWQGLAFEIEPAAYGA
nr:putative cardiolipin synthase YwiE [Paraburkholderia busanensis]